MGRKTAPQPLTLGSPDALGEGPHSGETYPPLSPPLSTRSAKTPSSPRSPRSALGFAHKKTQQVSTPQGPGDRKLPVHVADFLQQAPEQSLDGSQYPPISSTLQDPQHQHHPTGETAPAHIPRSHYQVDQSETQKTQHQHQQHQQEEQQQFQQQYRQHQVEQRDHQPPPVRLQQPPAQRHNRTHEEKASKSGFFFNFTKSSKSSERVNTDQYHDSRSKLQSRDTHSSSNARQNFRQAADSSHGDSAAPRQNPNPAALPTRSDNSLASITDHEASSTKKGKPKPFALLGRSRSIKDKDRDSPKSSTSPGESNRPPNPIPVRIIEPEKTYDRGGYNNSSSSSNNNNSNNNNTAQHYPPLRTAPIQAHDRSFRDMMSSTARNHSAERASVREGSSYRGRDNHQDGREQIRAQPPSIRETGSSSGFFSGLKSSGGKAADMISGRLFGKSGRSYSTTEREPTIDDEHYVLKVINLPLVEQARRTRICKRLEDSRDKTEFWMPAFPWRAIDYLNFKGSDVEGLYRIPGSGPQIKKWQRKFDEELDVDLFEQKDLYDINIIGSMLKAWLRELPDELFPKDAQERIVRECSGSEKVPELLKDELSNLSPFNYYLLFAITCHLSLLLAHSDKNKMDFRNLCICFQPCMKIDVFCFKFLVCDWRDCWTGCKNEAKYIEQEYAIFDSPPPMGTVESRKGSPAIETVEERNTSSSDSRSTRSAEDPRNRLRKRPATTKTGDTLTVETAPNITTTNLTVHDDRLAPSGRTGSNDLPALSPIKPLSPLGF